MQELATARNDLENATGFTDAPVASIAHAEPLLEVVAASAAAVPDGPAGAVVFTNTWPTTLLAAGSVKAARLRDSASKGSEQRCNRIGTTPTKPNQTRSKPYRTSLLPPCAPTIEIPCDYICLCVPILSLLCHMNSNFSMQI